jgi:hypothetical protein
VPRSKSPLSDPDRALFDENLAGIWESTGNTPDQTTGTGYYFIGRHGFGNDGPRGIMKAVEVRVWKDSLDNPRRYGFFVTHVGDDSFMNVLPHEALDALNWNKNRIESYCICKYRLDGDTLYVWQMNEKAAAAAIEKGAMKGTIKRDDKSGSVDIVLTSTTDDLVRFLASAGGKTLFPDSEKGTLHRLKKHDNAT